MKSSIIIVVASFVVILGFPIHVSADGRTDTVALESGPTGIAGVNYGGLFSNSVQLNNTGQVAYRSGLTGAGVTGGNDDAIWRDGNLIAHKGNATAIAGVNYGGLFFSSVRLNDTGQVAYWSFLTGTGVTPSNNSALWRDGNLIARKGNATTITGVNYGSFTVDFSTTIQLNDNGQVAYFSLLTGAGVTSSNDRAIWRDGSLIARQGNATGIAGVNYEDLSSSSVRLNDNGQVAYFSGLTGTGVNISNNEAIWRDGNLIAREGNATTIAGVNYAGLRPTPQLNDNGQVAYRSLLTGTGVTFSNNSALWRDGSLIAREGNATTIAGVDYGDFSSPHQLNDNGQVAYFSFLTGTGVTASNDTAIWRDGNLIVREGNATTITGVNHGLLSGSPQLNDNGQVLYRSFLIGTGVTPSNDSAFFISDGIDHVMAVRKGDPLEGSAIVNPISSTNLNNFGQLAYWTALADGRQGVFLFTPDLHWRKSFGSSWDVSNYWTLGLGPAQVHDVFIDPGSNLMVLGPAGAETVKSLTIGGGAGTATLRLQTGALTATDGVAIAATGILDGNGTLNAALINDGTLAPGNSPGIITVNGDYTQTTAGTLAVELGGLVSGSEYDVLNVTGTASLAGTLDVSLIDLGGGLFTPSPGDSFDILSADILSGQFDVLSLALLGSGLSWDLRYLIDEIGFTDIVRLSVASTVPVPPAVWLFGSGLLGLMGVARRRK